MGLAQSTAVFLRGHGHDAVHLREQGQQRLEDERIVEKARQEGRVILTHDLDFGRLIALSRSYLPSVITFRLHDMRPSCVNRFLSQVLDLFGDDLETGALVSVSESAIRVRRLPVEDWDS
jgi:predicted nuclease of predicted toxin-antitoxin system